MIERFKSLFGRKVPAAACREPTGETIVFNAYCTLLEIAQPTFAHKLHARRDLSDPELLEHLGEFCGHVQSRGEGKMSLEKYHVILHIQRVQHQVSIAVGVSDIDAFRAWAANANAVLLTPDGHVTDPQGRILVHAADGATDPAARVPYPEQARMRKAASEAALAARGIIVPLTLPPLVCEAELLLRGRDDVIERSRALLLVALRAESVACGEAMPVEALLAKMPLGDDALSPKEQAFLQHAAPSQQDCAQYIWRYEALLVLEWALGLVDELPFPAAPAEAAPVVATLIEMRGPQLRPVVEILDALDLHYRLHWHVRQSRLKNQGECAGVDADVLMERHHTLNWLVRFQHAPWDDIDTPT